MLLSVTKIFLPYFKSAKYFNIQKYDYKKSNVLGWQLLMIFCSLIKNFVQMLLLQIWAYLRMKICQHNLTLVTLKKNSISGQLL